MAEVVVVTRTQLYRSVVPERDSPVSVELELVEPRRALRSESVRSQSIGLMNRAEETGAPSLIGAETVAVVVRRIRPMEFVIGSYRSARPASYEGREA